VSKTVEDEEVRREADEQATNGEELVRRFRDGDAGAFDDLVREYQDTVFSVAYRMVNDREDAADLAQEVFVKVYRNLAKFRGDSKFSTWLYAIAMNTCRSGLRRTRRLRAVEGRSIDAMGGDEGRAMDPVDPDASPTAMLERREVRERVEQSVAELQPEFREVMVMRDIQGLSYDEIATALECSLGTVKSRLCRARMAVREKLQPVFGS
jgi:RNA polymerase sigma-70 factor (ECF subfamily)